MPFKPSSFDFLPYVERDRVRDVVGSNRKTRGTRSKSTLEHELLEGQCERQIQAVCSKEIVK